MSLVDKGICNPEKETKKAIFTDRQSPKKSSRKGANSGALRCRGGQANHDMIGPLNF
jgi:hypothetical protein